MPEDSTIEWQDHGEIEQNGQRYRRWQPAAFNKIGWLAYDTNVGPIFQQPIGTPEEADVERHIGPTDSTIKSGSFEQRVSLANFAADVIYTGGVAADVTKALAVLAFLAVPGPEDVVFAAFLSRGGLTIVRAASGKIIGIVRRGKTLVGKELDDAVTAIRRFVEKRRVGRTGKTSTPHSNSSPESLPKDTPEELTGPASRAKIDAPTPSRLSANELRTRKKNKAIDDYLEARGHKTEPNPLEGVEGAGRQGDRLVDGVKTEYKTLSPGASSSSIRNQVNNSIRREGQARNLVIDARGSGLTREDALEGIRRALGISRGKVDCLRIIGDGFDVSN